MGEDLDFFLSNNASQKRNIYMRQKKSNFPLLELLE